MPRSDRQNEDAWDSQFNQKRLVSYLNRRREILSPDSVILKTNSTTEAEWQKMLGTVDTMDDKLAQANTIFRWIRANISYDNEKGERSGIDDLEWFKAPQDTLTSRKGVCIDQALLAMESLRLIGFKEKDISVQSMLVYNLDGTPRMDKDGLQEAHAVLGLNIDGKKYVMDLTDRVGLWHEAKYYWPGGITGGEIMKPYMATNFKGTTYYQKNFLGPRPLSVEEQQPLIPLYSADDKHRYEAISGLAPLQAYEIKNLQTTPHTIEHDLNQIIMTSPTSGCVGRGCTF